MTPKARPALHPELRGKRLAVVLSGGGALGAYEVGVLRVLETIGLRPAILAGVSVGAINAVGWLVHDFRTRPLERVWSGLNTSKLGLRWSVLLLRGLGALVMGLGLVEVLLTLVSSQELSAARLFRRPVSVGADVQATMLDVVAWLLIALAGFLLLMLARPADRWVERATGQLESKTTHRWLGRGLLVAGAVHLLTLGFAVPWPHRFSATVILAGFAVWLFNRPGGGVDWARQAMLRVFPETGGRGVWPTAPRRRVIDRVVEGGNAARLVSHETHLIISACDLQTGRLVHFVNWSKPGDGFLAGAAGGLGEVVPLPHPPDLLRAVLASSAIPVLFEPVRIFGRDYVDAGPFSNQPIHLAIADDADAVLAVLLTPSGGLSPWKHDPHLMELGGRLIELSSWRELQSELRSLPPGWTRSPGAAGEPARICVVEPDAALPGGVLGFDPALAAELVTRGEADAWRALERAGWCAPAAV